LFPKISHAQPKTITSLIFFRGGSQSDGNDHEVKDFASDAVEKAEINEEAFQVKKSYDSSTQRDYHDIEDVEVIPFDSEDEIIPFDSEDESSSSIDSVDSVLVGSDNDENILENVEIIPFDTDYDEYNTYDTVPLPFDDMAEGYDYHSDRTIIDNADDVDRDQNDSCVEINLKDTHNRYVPGPEDMSESLISTENTTESFRRFSTLRDRILSLLSVWRDMDRENIEDGEEDSHSVRGMLHRRAAEYVEELIAFQTECTLSIAQNISISTTLEKMAPRPKTFLHYITPKIQAVKLSPEIMLRIRNAQPNDVGDAIRAIGILGCLVDLYNIALAELTPLVENRSYDQSEKVRREIREDRRFGQLLECASCGIDRRGRLEKFQNSQNDGILFPGAEDDQDVEENFSSDTEDDEEKQPECIEVSECSRWIMGMISLEVYGGMAIRSQNTTGVVLSLAMRSSDLLQASFRNVGTDEKARKSLLRDIIDTVRVLSCARDEWNIDVNFILDMCLELLWKDVASAQVNNEGIYSEYEMDEIVNKLTLSETIEIDDKISNSTSLPLNTTSLPLNSISTENDKYDDPSQNCASPPVRLIDYMSPQQRIVVVKSCTRLLGISRVARKTVSVLLDSCIDDLDSDIKMLKRAKAKDSTHEIECVDAVILFASIANKNDDEKLLNTVASKVAGSQEIFSQSINTSDKMQVEKSSIMHNVLDDNSELILEDLTVTRVPNRLPLESIATSVKARCRGVIWDQIQCAVPTFPISKSLKIMVSTKQGEVGSLFTNTSRSPQRSTYIDVSQVNSMQIAKNSLKTSLYDCSVIIQAVVSINHSTAARIMESCLKISAASSYETIQKMENGDAVNLISGIASIGSSMPMSLQAATKLSLMIRLTLCREYWTFSFTQLSRLLEAIATVISTQRFPIIHGLVDDESVLALIEHGMERMKCSDLATIQDLSNLAWAYAECNKLCSRSSWEHFEILGRCVAAVSSSFVHVIDMSTDENTSPVIDHNILCKIAFAVSLMDLDSHDLNQAILKYSRKDQSLFSSANLLNQIRLLYSIAKSKQDVEQSMSPEYNTDVKRCIGAVMKSKLDVLSPYNFALVVWSIGRLCGEEVSSLMTNLPSYTREELGVLSPTMTLRLVSIFTFARANSVLIFYAGMLVLT